MSSINQADLRQVQTLINECRERGDDAAIWTEHMARGIMRLIDADVVGAGHIGGPATGMENLGAVDFGWERGFNRQGWLNALTHFANNPTYHAGMTQGFAAVARGESSLLCRRQYIGDREWYDSQAYESTTYLMGFDDELCGFMPIGTADGDMQCLIIYRDKLKRRFTQAERNRLRVFMESIQPLVGGALAGFREIRPTDLPPRVREVLACILEGDSDKQIAKRLQISLYTVQQYTKQIYRFFQVEGRSELLSRWIRRGWSARCAWRNQDPPVVEKSPTSSTQQRKNGRSRGRDS